MKKCLLIDDDTTFLDTLTDMLQRRGYYVQQATNAADGLHIAAREVNFDVISIDLLFDSAPEGAEIARKLQELCPLSTLVLVSANAKGNIDTFIDVAFHGYVEKYQEGQGADLSAFLKEFVSGIEKAMKNPRNRLKSVFTEEELREFRQWLDWIEETIQFMLDKGKSKMVNGYTIAGGVCLLKNHLKNDNKSGSPLDMTILRDLADKDLRPSIIRTHNMFQHTQLNNLFAHKQKDGKLTENSLKVRQLLFENPTLWPNCRSTNPHNKKPFFGPVQVIMKGFGIPLRY